MSILLRAARGAAWNIICSLGARGIGLISTLIITRYLSPQEYGEVSVAVVLVLTADQLTQCGLFCYIVAKPQAGRSTVFHITVYNMLLAIIGLSVVLFFRNLFGPVFEAPALATFIPGMLLAVIFERMGKVPEQILLREMRFKVVALTRTVSEFTYASVAVILVIAGWGGQAIVMGNVAQWFVFMVAMVYKADHREWLTPHRLTWQQTRDIFSFGIPLAIETLANSASTTWDNLLVSRYFGPAILGAYTLAYQLANIPATHVGEHIGDVLLPSFARMNPQERKDALVYSSQILALVMFPLAVGLGAVAPTVTGVVFDARWESVAPMLSILAFLAVARPIAWTIGSYLQACNRPKTLMFLEIGKLVAIMAVITAVRGLGIIWVCVAVGVTFAIHALTSIWSVKRFENIPMMSLLIGTIPPFIACLPMVGAVYAVRYGLGQVELSGGVLALVLEILVGGLIFIPSGLILAPSISREFIRLGKGAIKSRNDDDEDEDEDDAQSS